MVDPKEVISSQLELKHRDLYVISLINMFSAPN